MNLTQIESAGKDDLIQELTRLKKRERDLKADNQRRANKLVGAVLTVGTGAVAGWYMESKAEEARKDPKFAEQTTEEAQSKFIAERQQILGIDADALLGLAAFGFGLTDMADGYSDTLLSIGSGALAVAGARMAAAKAKEPAKQE